MVAVAGLSIAVAVLPAVPVSAVTGSARPAAVTGAGSRTALLPTGDQVTVTDGPGGRRTAAIEPAAERGLGRVLLNLKLGGRSYEVPAAALPYLGRGLDVSLFDVDALLAREGEARVPVEVRHSGTPPALPGLTVTGTRSTAAAGTTTTGYLTGSSAREFGAALVRQFLDDRAHHAFGTRGLFAGGTAIRLAGTTDTPAAQPRFPMRTLTVNATDAAGRPDQGDPVFLYNVDDSGRRRPRRPGSVDTAAGGRRHPHRADVPPVDRYAHRVDLAVGARAGHHAARRLPVRLHRQEWRRP